MQVYYLEIVTLEVDETCNTYEKLHNVNFGEAVPGLGNARTVKLMNGGMIGVRAPMHESEDPVIRPYLLVEDIHAATAALLETGGEIAHPPMEIPEFGIFAIYIQGANHHGLWQI